MEEEKIRLHELFDRVAEENEVIHMALRLIVIVCGAAGTQVCSWAYLALINAGEGHQAAAVCISASSGH